MDITSKSSQNKLSKKVSAAMPFFELGPIKTTDYAVDLDEAFKQEGIKNTKFSPDNATYLNVTLKPIAPFNLMEIVGSDRAYVKEHSPLDLKSITETTGAMVALCAVKQMLNTFDPQIKSYWVELFQILDSTLELPHVWNQFANLYGNRSTDYGLIKLQDPIQTVINFLVASLVQISHDTYGQIIDDSSRKYQPALEFFRKAVTDRNKQKDLLEKYFYFPNVSESRAAMANYAMSVWDSAQKPIVYQDELIQVPGPNGQMTEKKVRFPLRLPSSRELLQIPDSDKAGFSALIDTLPNREEKAAVALLVKAIFQRKLNQREVEEIGKFTFVDTELATVVTAVIAVRGYFLRHIQPEIKRLYKCEPFKPTKQGHSCLLVERAYSYNKFLSKVNLPKYSMALGCTIDATERVTFNDGIYQTKTELNKDSLSVFAIKDLNFSVGH